MKTVYVCEKCGKQFETYEEVYKCEESHRTVETIDRWDLASKDRYEVAEGHTVSLGDELQDYTTCKALPDTIMVKYWKTNEDGAPVIDEYGYPVYGVVFYSIDKTTNKVDAELLRRVEQSLLERNKEQHLEIEGWKKRKEAEAAQLQAQAEKEEK